MLKKISFKQIAINDDQMFALSVDGDVFEHYYDKVEKKSAWIKLPTEYDDGVTTVTATVTAEQPDGFELGHRDQSFWDAYHAEQKRKQR